MNYRDLSEKHLDALREASNIGMGHAATALSQLIGRTIRLQVPEILISEIREVPAILGGAERVVVGIYLQILGDARGNILLIFPIESARQLLGALLPDPGNDAVLSEMENSTLKEVGNILASAYLSALGNLVGMVLIPSIPMISHDMAGAVVDNVLIELGESGDLALVVETEFFGEDQRISGHLFIFPDPKSLAVILKAIEF